MADETGKIDRYPLMANNRGELVMVGYLEVSVGVIVGVNITHGTATSKGIKISNTFEEEIRAERLKLRAAMDESHIVRGEN